MLPVRSRTQVGLNQPPTRADRSMLILQYAIAGVAVAAAILLSVR
jgi:hypothetical protein